MRVRDLGSLVVTVDAEDHLVAGTRGPAMLALLIINTNHRVSVDALMDAAWGEHVTAGAASTLESHVWRLRQILEPGRVRGRPPTVLVNDAGGYRLVAGSSSVDSLFLAQCAAEVRDLLATGHADDALRRADAALTLWRGRPYGAFADLDWAQAAVARLEEVRGQLQERRVEALLATGALDLALADLQPLVAAMPYREALRSLQMTALYQAGRSEQALQVYTDVRRTLVDEVGIEPGPELQRLHHQILDNDVPAARALVRVEPAAHPVEVHLPPAPTALIGRDEVVATLTGLVEDRPLVTITGSAGAGKTRLAVEVARAVAPSFRDGVWFVDLTAVVDPDLVVDVVVSTIGFAASAGATPLEDLRSYLRTRRVLVVLDNCEHVLSGVAALAQLLVGDPGAGLEGRLLATSREPLNVGGETVWNLGPLSTPQEEFVLYPTASPAVELFLERLRAAAPTLAVDEQALARVVEICQAVDGLPLALELAAARAASYTLDDIAAQVRGDASRLGRIGRGPTDHRATVRSAVDWSYRLLPPREQRAHRRLSVLPGQFTSTLAAVAMDELDPGDADDLMAQLVHRSMLVPVRRPGRPTGFRQLATVRGHARHALAAADEAAPSLERRDAWTTALVAARPPLGSAAEPGWYERVDDDYDTVRATLARRLIERPDAVGATAAVRLNYYWYYREQMVEGRRWLEQAHVVLREHPVEGLLARTALASLLAVQGRIDLATPYIRAVLEDLRDPSRLPEDRLVEIGETLVGLAASAWVPDAHALVIALHERLLAVAELAGAPHLRLLADAVGCVALFAAGRIADAVAQAHEVRPRAEAADNLMATWVAAGAPTIAALLAGDPAEGVPWVNRLVRAHLRLGTGASGSFLETRASFAAMAGEHRLAARVYAAAYTETRRAAMRWPRRPLTEQLLARTQAALGPAAYENAWREGEGLSATDVLRIG